MVEETRRFELMKGELRPTPWEVTVSKATCPGDIWVHADSSLSQLGESSILTSCHSIELLRSEGPFYNTL